ncbi:hypothetical protein PMAG_b0627 [Pseudoalteromonas mariniglutinosa NCIMB 1770]|nr:hypothetical protein [Pseudoalteromonas mariniglutinosa NCIMB 1770]
MSVDPAYSCSIIAKKKRTKEDVLPYMLQIIGDGKLNRLNKNDTFSR